MIIKRSILSKAISDLESEQFLLFIGPRQAGKTTILKQLQLQSLHYPSTFINLEDRQYLTLLNESPKNLFKLIAPVRNQRQFVFIDEIQYLDHPTNFLKLLFDEYREKVKLIVSGSSAFYLDTKFHDSLVGRKKIFQVNTLSFIELFRYRHPEIDSISIKNVSKYQKDSLYDCLYEYMTYGGYPRVVLAQLEDKAEILRDITYSYVKKDVYEANIRNDLIFYQLLKILASQIGNLVNASELANTLGVSKTAINNYLYIMQKSFHINLIPPFYKAVRKEIIKMPKVYFHDLGLRNFLANNFLPLVSRADKGQLLENLVFLLLQENNSIEDIKFWRTISENEIDFVVNDLAYEVKTSQKPIRKSKYKIFQNKYPEIQLEFINLNNVLDFVDNQLSNLSF